MRKKGGYMKVLRVALVIIWLLGAYGLIWLYGSTVPQTISYSIYVPEKFERHDEFWDRNAKEISLGEFRSLPKNSPKVLRVDFDNSNEIRVYYFGRTDDSLRTLKTSQLVNCSSPGVLMSYAGVEILPSGWLKVNWERPGVFLLGLLALLLAVILWLIYVVKGDSKKKKSSQEPSKC
jgi:hypothetical protein